METRQKITPTQSISFHTRANLKYSNFSYRLWTQKIRGASLVKLPLLIHLASAQPGSTPGVGVILYFDCLSGRYITSYPFNNMESITGLMDKEQQGFDSPTRKKILT